MVKILFLFLINNDKNNKNITPPPITAFTPSNITNDDTPSFTLSGLTVSDSIFLYVNGVLNQKDIAIAATHTFISSGLIDFTHEITMKAKDYAGNLSEFSNPLSIRVDTTPYTIVSAPNLLAEDDSGISSTDNITNNRTPRLEFSQLASVKDSIRLFIDNGVSNEFLIGGRKGLDKLKDTLTVPTSSRLDEGAYTFTYVVIDSAGNTSAASSGSVITVDVTAPAAPTAPAVAVDLRSPLLDRAPPKPPIVAPSAVKDSETRSMYKILASSLNCASLGLFVRI